MSDLEKRFPVYSTLLRLYPRSYRQAFGEQLLQATADMMDATPDRADRLRAWTAIFVNFSGDVMRQQLISIGESMSTSKRIIISVIWIAICVSAILIFPELRKVGTTWMDTAGSLRVIYLGLFVLLFIVATPIMAVLSWLGRPKSLYAKLARL